MPVKLGELAGRVGGELVGDPDLLIEGARPLSDARQGEITLLDQLRKDREGCKQPPVRASAVVAPRGYEPGEVAAILVDDCHAAFAEIISIFRPPRASERRGVSPLAFVSPTARLEEDVEIYPLATIGDDVEIGRGATIHSGAHVMSGSKIGPGATVFPNAVLYENTVIGARCLIHAGASLGTAPLAGDQGDRQPAGPPRGNVKLADEVDVGAATVIDRGLRRATTVGENAKIDNHVTIGPDAEIGPHDVLCSQAVLMRRCRLGRYVVAAGQAAVSPGVEVGDGAVLGGKASIHDNVPARARVVGVPAIIERDFWVQQLLLEKVPEMSARLESLQAAVQQAEIGPR
jgi:UDP-3-O-[3-hydroxymyristoyl] glucosamine N-acyltransferase